MTEGTRSTYERLKICIIIITRIARVGRKSSDKKAESVEWKNGYKTEGINRNGGFCDAA